VGKIISESVSTIAFFERLDPDMHLPERLPIVQDLNSISSRIRIFIPNKVLDLEGVKLI
jgi:hypothetical protein